MVKNYLLYLPEVHPMQFEELNFWKETIEEQDNKIQAALKELTASTQSGKDDLPEQAHRFQTATQIFIKTKADCANYLIQLHQKILEDANQARNRGVEFPSQVVEIILPDKLTERPANDIVQTIASLQASLSNLIDCIQRTGRIEAELTTVLTSIEAEIDRFDKLGITKSTFDPEAQYKSIHSKLKTSELRSKLLKDAQQLLQKTRSCIEDQVTSSVDNIWKELENALARVRVLGSILPDDESKAKSIRTRIDKLDRTAPESEDVIKEARGLLQELKKRADQDQAELNRHVESLLREAKIILENLPVSLPEQNALRDLIDHRPTNEAELTDYLVSLENCKEEVLRVSEQALEGYVQRTKVEGDFLFENKENYEVLGEAILTAAFLQSEYSTGRVWEIAEEILIRILVSGLDANDFYNRFGRLAIARSLRTALERDEFVEALTFLAGDFIPQTVGKDRTERIRELMLSPILQDVFSAAIRDRALNIDKNVINNLGAQHVKTMFELLSLDDTVGLPKDIRLQWAAWLHSQTDPQNQVYLQISMILLKAMADEGLFLGLYYSLLALGDDLPQIWQEGALQSMLFPLIRLTDTSDPEGQQFLIELGSNPNIASLASNNPEMKFLLASLYEYLILRSGQEALMMDAWQMWDSLESAYPVLVTLLKNLLQNNSEKESELVFDEKKVRKELANTLENIQGAIDSHHYRGVRLAEMIHSWFVREYMESWLDLLQSNSNNSEKIDQGQKTIKSLLEARNLADLCPFQDTPPDPNMRRIEGRLKTQLNGRLTELLEWFQQAFRMYQLLHNPAPRFTDYEKLQTEIQKLSEESQIKKWSFETLLRPNLPLADETIQPG